MVKILFYADPARIYDMFLPSVTVLRDHLFNFCGKALQASGQVEMKAVVSEIAGWQATDGIDGIELLPMRIEELRDLFPDCKSLDAMQRAFFCDGLDGRQLARLEGWLKNRLGDWQPDIVIAFPTQTAPLRKIFPAALCLTMENGIFSRHPGPRMLRFEPVDFMNGFLNRYRAEIWNYPITEENRVAVERFRRQLTEALSRVCPYKKELEQLRTQFAHLVLCPVPAGNFYGEAAFDDQFVWLADLMGRIPKEIGVIVTFHDNVSAQLNAKTIRFFQSRYKNLLVFDPKGLLAGSAVFFPFVDAILNCETMTGAQGMLVCPRIVSLDKTYSGWMADATGADSLADVLARPVADRVPLVYWYLTHFTVGENRFDDPTWYLGYFQGLLERYRANGITFDLFVENESFETVAGVVMNAIRRNTEDSIGRMSICSRCRRSVLRRLARWFRRLSKTCERHSGQKK